LLSANNLALQMLATFNAKLIEQGLLLKEGKVGKCAKGGSKMPINWRKVREMREAEEHNLIW